MKESTQTIALSVTLKADFATAQAQVTDALKAQGFGILTEIDVQSTFKNKINVDFRPYKILGACNPQLAHRALSATSEVGLLLPCNVTLSQIAEGEVQVSFIDPLAMMSVIEMPELVAIAEEAKTKLEIALHSLQN